MKYKISAELYAEATKAKAWHEATGMRVARPPAIPHIVASWILLKCQPDEPGRDAMTEPAPFVVGDIVYPTEFGQKQGLHGRIIKHSATGVTKNTPWLVEWPNGDRCWQAPNWIAKVEP